MAKTVDRRSESASSPKDVGRQLRHVRRKQGLSRSEVARSAGLTRRELAAYERGRVDIPESDLWCLAGSCGVDVSELLPHRDKLRVDSNLSSLAIGDTIRHLRSPGEPDGLLNEYLSMIYELRNLPPGTRIPLREEDLRTLADALGGSPDMIEAKLVELIGANRDEAARLRAMILPPMALPAPGTEDQLGAPTDDFFATPRAADPFAPPPPLMVPDPAAPPVDATPVEPIAVDPIAVDPMPVDAAPVEPTLVDQPPVDATPVDAAPVDPTLPMASPLAPVTPPGRMEPMPPVETTPPDIGATDMTATDMTATDMTVPDMPTPDVPPMGMPPVGPPVDLPPPTESMSPDDAPMAADATTALPIDPFAVPVDGPDPLAVLRGDPAPDDLDDGPRPFDPDAARDGIVIDYGDSFAPSSPSMQWDDQNEPRVAPHTVLDVPPAPLSEAPIDVHNLDAPTGAIPDLDAPLGVADYADVFDSAPPEVAALDHTPYGLEIDAEPLPDAMPPAAMVEPEPIVTDPGPEPTITSEPTAAPEPIVYPETITPDADVTAAVEAIEVVAPIEVASQVEADAPTADEPAAIKWHAPALAIEAPATDAVDDEPPGNDAGHFTKAGPDWQVGGMSPATAMADDGALALRRAEARWALCDVHQAGDFTAEAVVDFTAGTGFGILFRASVDDHDRIDGYSFDVDSVTAGGGYLIRQWEANRPHWRPLAQAHVTDATMLFGRHTITLTVRGDQLTVHVDGETVLTAPSLSRLSVDLGREPARGDRLGVQAGTTTEVTVDRFAAAAI